MNFPTTLLKNWFIENKRTLPWRENPSPYRVWISEVMLQQTQASVVAPYFKRWMQIFPSIYALAEAPLESVLKMWEGLGYYSRARHLHEAAQELVEFHGGELPSQLEKLQKIKGLGPYTCAAILSFAFRQRAAAVDGNVIRVLSRYLAIEEEVSRTSVQKQIREYVTELLPDEESWLVSEGLIELGATVCTKTPQCSQCPLRSTCLAFRHRLQNVLPKRRARPETILLQRHVAVIHYQDQFLLRKEEKGKVMADLYEFPYVEKKEKDFFKQFEGLLGMRLSYQKSLCEQEHSFTRYRVRLFPHLFQAQGLYPSYIWKKREELQHLPFSAGHKRILTHLLGT